MIPEVAVGRVRSVLKWTYFTVLLAATAAGAWAARPYIAEQSAKGDAPLAVQVYSHPFVSVFKDTAISRGPGAIDSFFTQDVFNEAVAAVLRSRPPPFPKAADRDAWGKDLASDLTFSLNSHMARRYIDSLQRLGVSNDAKGLVMVRVENVGAKPVEEVRVEVMGGQLFMEGSPSAAKFRSLGTRAVRLAAVGPGEKLDLFVLTTEDLSPGGAGPHVKVTAKGQTFPVIVHALDAPLRPTPRDIGWTAFGVVYLALIFAGLGVKAFSLTDARTAPPTADTMASGRAIFSPAPVSAPVQLTDAELKSWQRPNAG